MKIAQETNSVNGDKDRTISISRPQPAFPTREGAFVKCFNVEMRSSPIRNKDIHGNISDEIKRSLHSSHGAQGNVHGKYDAFGDCIGDTQEIQLYVCVCMLVCASRGIAKSIFKTKIYIEQISSVYRYCTFHIIFRSVYFLNNNVTLFVGYHFARNFYILLQLFRNASLTRVSLKGTLCFAR